MRHWVLALLLLTCASTLARRMDAQIVRGIVSDSRGLPVAGALILLLENSADGATAAVTNAPRALSDESGAYRLTATRAGSYRLRTQRIGFRPVMSPPFQLGTGETRVQPVVLADALIALDTLRVASRGVCRLVTQDSAAAMFAVWEQVRLALSATDITTRAGAINATTIAFNRTFDRTGRRLLDRREVTRTDRVRQLWRSLSPDSLHRVGYVMQERDSVAYFAPGLEVLLSARFIEDHCLRLITSPADSTLLGLAFEPTQLRRRLPEVSGTLWLSRHTAELRKLEYRYTNVTRAQAQYAGGDMRFVRLRNGAWVVSHWSIRMPLMTLMRTTRAMAGADTVVTGLLVSGAELSLATATRTAAGRAVPDTLWSSPTYSIAGVVSDSVSDAPVQNARVMLVGSAHEVLSDTLGRFSLAGVPSGEHVIEVRGAWHGAIGAAHQSRIALGDGIERDSTVPMRVRVASSAQIAASLCRNTRFSAGEGVIVGVVALSGDTTTVARARVSAEWREISVRGGAGQPRIEQPARIMETRTDARGEYRLCGVPANTDLLVRAHAAAAVGAGSGSSVAGATAAAVTLSASPVRLRMTNDERVGRAELFISTNAAVTAVFSGVIVADSTLQPVSAAEITLSALSLTTRSNADGSFRLAEIPPGLHDVVVRRVGYAPLNTRIDFVGNETETRRMVMRRAVMLDSVRVTESVVLRSFEEHRRVGLGHFLTRDDLERMRNQTMPSIVSQFPGAAINRGRGNYAWLAQGRGRLSLDTSSLQKGGDIDSLRGARIDCYAQVYLNDARVYGGGKDEDLFDLSSIAPDQVEAMEYYSGPAQTPSRYSGLNSRCGVLVIWTRRSP